MRILPLILIILVLCVSADTQAAESTKKSKSKNKSAAPAAAASYAKRPDAMAWAERVAQENQLDPKWVKAQLAQAKLIPSIPKLILPPAQVSQKNWAAYRARFIEPKRIQAGIQFWQRHQALLSQAEQHTGNFRVLDALSTLTFDFPKEHPRATERQAFFSKELAQFLVITSKENIKPANLKGSYAGAMGLPQFMPSSWAKFAVDFDGDKHIDLFGNPADVIGSVANYFKAFQWQAGMPTHYPVKFDSLLLDMDALMAPDILPTFSVNSFLAKGAVVEGDALLHKGQLALIELLNGNDPPSYVAGTENFYAITRYNWSSYYAMAVIELGEAVAREMPSKP